MIRLHRVYDSPVKVTGKRFLVERLWPRGVKKKDLNLDEWLPEAAPSHELRKWFKHDPAKWDEFRQRYEAELDANPQAWQPLMDAASNGNIVLLFSSKDTKHNNVAALKSYLERRLLD
ncbi:MAG: hypothetical protein AMXMBFR84_33430 [Candidatus Hydrogenedentota bacterium]